jgi:hypothetical protein
MNNALTIRINSSNNFLNLGVFIAGDSHIHKLIVIPVVQPLFKSKLY